MKQKHVVNLLTFWIPLKSWRKKCRNKLMNLFVSKALIRKIREKYPEGILFLSPHAGIGEFVQSLCLMRALKNKISEQIVIITAKKTEQDICKLYRQTVSCYYDPDVKIYETSDMIFPLQKGKIYPFYRLPKPMATKRAKDIDFLKDFFQLPQNIRIEKIQPKRPETVNDNLKKLEDIFLNRKTILIFPEANTYDSSVITKEVWLDAAKKLQAKGYTCIFNSQHSFEGFLSIFLPIDETVYLSSLATAIITFRSGLSELIALATACKMLVIYPNGTTHLFREECRVSMDDFLKRIKRMPLILSMPDNPIISTFKIGSLADNFERMNVQNYYYDFNDNDFIHFVLNKV